MSETYVVILQHGDLSGIQKIWGPYPDRPAADAAQVELAEWPLYGLWSVEPVCAFPAAASAPEPIEQQTRGRRVMSHELLAQVAEVYRAAYAEGSPPTRAVGQHFDVSHRTAARWVSEARKLAILGKASGTRAGEVAAML